MPDAPQEVIVRYGDRSFYGVVRREFESGGWQVTTEAAKLIAPRWESLVFDARGNSIIGIATVVFPSTMGEFAELARLAPVKEAYE